MNSSNEWRGSNDYWHEHHETRSPIKVVKQGTDRGMTVTRPFNHT